MGGEGAMMAMINAIKNNKSLLSKRKDKKALSGSYANVKLNDFPEATPKMLHEIRIRMAKERKQRLIKMAIAFAVAITGLTLFLIYII